MKMVGGCLCGAVRYRSEAQPLFSGVCHCRDCQKFTGSAFGVMVGVPKTSVIFDGNISSFSSIGGSGKPIIRFFCPKCGSSIAEETSRLPDQIVLNVGTLDDPHQMKPVVEIFRDDALAWVQVNGVERRFGKVP
jgi:hypothetical protein